MQIKSSTKEGTRIYRVQI